MLDTFIAVYETRQFLAAAAELHVSQSTVSERIAALEKRVGHRLFDRPARRDVVPTAAGERLYVAARSMTSEWSEALADIAHDARAREPFRILTSHTATHVLLPKVLKVCGAFLGEISIVAAERNSGDIFAAVSAKEAEFAIIEKPLSGESVMRTTLIEDRLVRAGDPHAPWLVREEGSGVRYYTELYFRGLSTRPATVIEVANNEAICRTLESGFGQSVVSVASLDSVTGDSVPREALGPEFVRRFYALTPRSGLSAVQKRVSAQVVAAIS
jgi:DNA-binding transcriptional LysR family regulator